jgi:hypothetical protein
MLKAPGMAVGLDTTSRELTLQTLKTLLIGDLPPIVLSDDRITKMHDSLPMVLFRFETLTKLDEAREFVWLAYCFPWVVLNEAMLHQTVTTMDRVGWFRLAYAHFMTCRDRWHHYLECSTPEQCWTEDEDLLLRRAVAYHGTRWGMIRPLFPSRSASDLRHRWILHCFGKEGFQNDLSEFESKSQSESKRERKSELLTDGNSTDTADNSKTETSQLSAMVWGPKTGFWFDIENIPTYADY